MIGVESTPCNSVRGNIGALSSSPACRPPAESRLAPPEPEVIIMTQDLIGRVIPSAGKENGECGLGESADARRAILEIGSRHLLRKDQMSRIENA